MNIPVRKAKPWSPAVKPLVPVDVVKLAVVEHDVPDLSDFCMPIVKLQARLAELAAQYGPDAVISVDAGHNNVQVMLRREE